MRLFKRKPKFTIKTLVLETPQPSSISPSASITIDNGEHWAPFSIPVSPALFGAFYEQFILLRTLCLDSNYTFSVSPAMTGDDGQKRFHIYMESFDRENKQVFDIDLWLNDLGKVDTYTFLTRERLYAFGKEKPYLINRTSLARFDEVLTWLQRHFSGEDIIPIKQ
jgi:hypothetical protein